VGAGPGRRALEKMAAPPIYVISIDPRRYARTAAELRAHGLEPTLFEGTDGTAPPLREDWDVSRFARHFCPAKTLGCALSHLRLARTLARAWPAADAVLVLEDDVRVTGATPAALAALARTAADWDVLRLYCQGRCAPHARLFAGSAAAYLLSRRGAAALAGLQAVYHVDMQLGGLRAVNGPRLFSTLDCRDGFLIGDQRLQFWLHQPFLRLPGCGRDVSFGLGLGGALALLALCAWLRGRRPALALVGALAVLAAFAALYERAHGPTVRRTHQRTAAALTLGAAALVGAVAWALQRGRLHLAVAAPLLFVLETSVVAGLIGLASLE